MNKEIKTLADVVEWILVGLCFLFIIVGTIFLLVTLIAPILSFFIDFENESLLKFASDGVILWKVTLIFVAVELLFESGIIRKFWNWLKSITIEEVELYLLGVAVDTPQQTVVEDEYEYTEEEVNSLMAKIEALSDQIEILVKVNKEQRDKIKQLENVYKIA